MEVHPLSRYGVRSYFEREWMDNALMVGMTPDEFWYGDPELFYNYARRYSEQFKLTQQNVWQIGARMCQALSSTPIMPLGVLGANDLKKAQPYPPCPYVNEQKSDEMSPEEVELALAQFKARMMSWAGTVENKKE